MPDERPLHGEPSRPEPMLDAAKLACPCCGSRLTLSGSNGTARLHADEPALLVPSGAGSMFIDPHAHMISRTTDDYEAMARAGVVAVIEPAL